MRAALVLLALVVALLAGGRASAHAQLVAADPAAGAILAEAPAVAVLTFSEPVRPLAVRWFPPRGDPVEATPVAEGARLSVPLPSGGGTGTFLLSWRVASADGHPVGGSHAFSVGAPTPAARPAAERTAWAAAAGRGILTLALVLGAGGAVSLRLLDSRATPLPRARRLASCAACAVFPAALLAGGLHGLDILGPPAAALLGPAPWAATLRSPFAATIAASLLAAVAALGALHRPGRASAAFALAGWILAAASFALFGHAATASPRWLAAPAIALHAGAVIFWLGALPALAERALATPRDLLPSLRRFSRIAVPLVGLLVLSGTLLAIVQVGDPARLLATPYGRLLVAKLLLVLPLLGLAALNRLVLTPATARGDPRAPARFRRSVRAEILLMVVILAVASGFRLTPPPRSLQAAADATVHAHLHGPTLMAGLALTPGRRGPNALALTLYPDTPRPLEVRVSFADPARGIEPIRVAAIHDGPTWRADGVFLPHGGAWKVAVEVLISDFDRTTLTSEVALPDF